MGDLIGVTVLLRCAGLVLHDDAGLEFVVIGVVFVFEDDVLGGESMLDGVLADGGGGFGAEWASGEGCVAAVGRYLFGGCHFRVLSSAKGG